MTLHGIGAMVGELSVEPLVQGGDHRGFGCSIDELGPAVNISVVDGNLNWLGRTKLVQARHVLAVNVRRAGEVASEKLLFYLLQMLPHELNLTCLRDRLCNDALGASLSSLDEDVGCGLTLERHDVLASLGNLGLTLGIGSNSQLGHG